MVQPQVDQGHGGQEEGTRAGQVEAMAKDPTALCIIHGVCTHGQTCVHGAAPG